MVDVRIVYTLTHYLWTESAQWLATAQDCGSQACCQQMGAAWGEVFRCLPIYQGRFQDMTEIAVCLVSAEDSDSQGPVRFCPFCGEAFEITIVKTTVEERSYILRKA